MHDAAGEKCCSENVLIRLRIRPPAGQFVGKIGWKAAPNQVPVSTGALGEILRRFAKACDQMLARQSLPVLRFSGEGRADHRVVDTLLGQLVGDTIRAVATRRPGSDQTFSKALIRLPTLVGQTLEDRLDLVADETPIGQLAGKL